MDPHRLLNVCRTGATNCILKRWKVRLQCKEPSPWRALFFQCSGPQARLKETASQDAAIFNGITSMLISIYASHNINAYMRYSFSVPRGGGDILNAISTLVITQQSPTRMRAVFNSFQHAPVSNTHQYISLQCSIYIALMWCQTKEVSNAGYILNNAVTLIYTNRRIN